MKIKIFKVNVFFILIALVHTHFGSAQHQSRKSEFIETRNSLIETKQNQLRHSRLFKPSVVSQAQKNYDVTYYQLNLDIDPLEQILSGIVEIRGVAKIDQFEQVELDFYTNMEVDSIAGNGQNFIHQNDQLQIDLSQSINTGESFTVTVFYHGTPEPIGFGGFRFDVQNGTPLIWSLSEPYFARTWWPCKDSPKDKADSVDIVLTVPDNLTAVSNGNLLENVDNGDGTRTFHWQEKYPITTYLVSVAITNYDSIADFFSYSQNDSMEVRLYVYSTFLEDAYEILPRTLAMLEYFHEIFGPYPFLKEKYGIAQFGFGGGMEHQTISSQGRFGEILTAHELAHQWFGDKITNATWGDIWLNEGFASYAEALFFEHDQGQQYYHDYMSLMDFNFSVPIYVEDTTSTSKIFNRSPYDKGAWFLHMLRHVVGDSTFFDILLAYSMDPNFAYGNATTAGFQGVCETVSSMDLDWFFEPWIYHVGRPVYKVEWSPVDSLGSDFLHLKIQQTQYPARVLFPMPIDITVQTEVGDTTFVVFNDAASQTFSLELAGKATGIEFDKDNWILKRIEGLTVVGENPEIVSSFSLQQNYPNPFHSRNSSSANSIFQSTTIEFYLPGPENASVEIFNILGQKIITLLDEELPSGNQRVIWDGTDRSGKFVPSGVYLFRLNAGNFSKLKKMILL